MKLHQLFEAPKVKKLLFINFTVNEKEEAISAALSTEEYEHVTWSQLQLRNGEIYVNGMPLSTFTGILIGAVGDEADMYSCVVAYAEAKRLKHLSYGQPTLVNNKILQSLKLAQADVRQIKTIVAKGDEVTAQELIDELKLPIVSKIVHGSQGDGVEKHDSPDELEVRLYSAIGETLIFQEFIPNDSDVRAFFIKNELVYALKRTRQDADEFRNNISLGGEHEAVELDVDALKLAKAAVKSLGFDVSGVDLIQNKITKEWFVMEVNSAPQILKLELPEVAKKLLELIS